MQWFPCRNCLLSNSLFNAINLGDFIFKRIDNWEGKNWRSYLFSSIFSMKNLPLKIKVAIYSFSLLCMLQNILSGLYLVTLTFMVSPRWLIILLFLKFEENWLGPLPSQGTTFFLVFLSLNLWKAWSSIMPFN